VTVDIICGFILVLLTGLGYKSGAIAQIVRLGGLVAAFFAAPYLADLATEDEPILHWGLTALAFAAIYTAVAIIGHFLLSRDKGPSKNDRLAGAALGTLKAAALTGLVAASLHILESDLRRVDPQDRLHVQHSMVVATARRVENWLGL
jgi:uncharacterized membrane protein required for colicin V production